MANRRLAATIAALFTATAWATPAVAQEPEPVAVEPPAASAGTGAAGPVEAAAVPTNEHGWIDTSDRELVLQSFVDEFLTETPAPQMSGSVDTCGPVTVSSAYRDAIHRRISWYRGMAGTGTVLPQAGPLNTDAGKIAVWSSANWVDKKYQGPHDLCKTQAIERHAGDTVVVLGATGRGAIDYSMVFGEERSIDGDRSTLLYPRKTGLGIGDVPVPFPGTPDDPAPASAIVLAGDVPGSIGPVRHPSGLVAWPPAGYFPGAITPGRWSLHGPFHAASANVQVWVDGVRVAAPRRAGTSALYFEPDLPEGFVEDIDVRVRVTGITGGRAYDETTTITGLRPKGGVPYQRARSVYRTVTPCRVADTRRGFERRFGPNEMDTVQVTGDGPIFEIQGATPDGCGIPADATAVEATQTAVNPSSDGYARVGAALDAENPNANLLMYTAGRNRSVSSTIPLSPGATGHLALWNVRGSTDYAVDVHGYYVPEAQPGLKYTPVTPCRTADTRQAGGALGTSTNRAVQISGTCGVPANAEAVKTTITAVPTSTRTGYLRTWASQTRIPNASFLQHHRKGETVTNTGNVAIGSNGKIALGNRGGSSHYTVDVLGYYAPDGELTYTPIQACRAVDTRTGVGTFGARRRAFEVVGTSDSADDRAAFVAQGGDADTCDVPTTATAVDTTVTALDPVGSGYAIVWPSMTRQPKVRALNYRSGDWTTNHVTVPTGNQQRIALANVGGTTNYLLELTGYYEP